MAFVEVGKPLPPRAGDPTGLDGADRPRGPMTVGPPGPESFVATRVKHERGWLGMLKRFRRFRLKWKIELETREMRNLSSELHDLRLQHRGPAGTQQLTQLRMLNKLIQSKQVLINQLKSDLKDL